MVWSIVTRCYLFGCTAHYSGIFRKPLISSCGHPTVSPRFLRKLHFARDSIERDTVHEIEQLYSSMSCALLRSWSEIATSTRPLFEPHWLSSYSILVKSMNPCNLCQLCWEQMLPNIQGDYVSLAYYFELDSAVPTSRTRRPCRTLNSPRN